MKWSTLLCASLVTCLALGSAACGGGEETPNKPRATKKKPGKKDAKDSEKGGGDSASGYQVIEVSNGGTIKGVVKWTGGDVNLEKLPVAKDSAACGGDSKDSPRLIVDKETQGVANAVVYLEGITKGKDLTPKDGTLDQKACEYIPHVQLLPKGSKLTSINSDPILHNVHAYLGNESLFNLAMPTQGMTIDKPMKKPGIVSFKCDAGHTWMSAYAFVIDHPYYAITNEKGEFVIDGVPEGNYKVTMWHEGWQANISSSSITYSDPVTETKSVDVASGAEAEVNFELK